MAEVTIPGDSKVSLADIGSEVTLAADDHVTLGPDGARVEAEGMPERIGRHRIDRVLGRGGMGVVYAAHDPELDRPIAIKLVDRIPRSADATSQASARMKREAQAMAKLNHRNVISVYDVGEEGEQLYIAMELVDGCSLRDWVKTDPPPSVEAILDAYVQAGEGLVAAHRAGLVHRDFKPENAMRGSDGVVRVLDFGLAQPAGERLVSEAEPSTIELSSPHVTRTGAVVGTPAYMAPEQFEGQAADARSDQFSFCVSMWEALYGERPFPGADLAALAYSVTSGELRFPKSSRGVPKWMRRVMLRGLATDPDERWPSMRALLAAIAHHRRPRRRWLLPAVGAVALGSASLAAVMLYERSEVCAGGHEALAGSWDDERRAAVTAAFEGSDATYAGAELERALGRIDAYADRWATVHEQVCEATRVHGTQSEEALDRQMACLHERRGRLRALVSELERGDLIEGAAKATRRLPSPEACADLESLAHVLPVPEDPALAEQVAGVRTRLADAAAAITAGRFDDAMETVEAALTEAESIGFDPLTAEALERRASLLHRRGKLDEAKADFERSFNLALGAGHDAIAHVSAAGLMYVYGVEENQLQEAHKWLASAQATLRRAQLGPVDEATLLVNESNLRLTEGKFQEAADLAVQARELLQDELEEGAPEYVEVNMAEAMARARLGEIEPARVLFVRNVELAEGLGAGHPDLVRALTNLGVIEQMAGNLVAAREAFETALPMAEANDGPDHENVASILNNLGGSAYELQDYDTAKASHQRALKIRRKLYGKTHGAVAQSLHNLANAYAGLGDDEKAVELTREAIRIREELFGPDHPVIASALGNLSNSLVRLGRADEALEVIDRAIEIRRKALGPDHPDVAYSLTAKAEVLSSLQRYADAIGPLERALEIREADELVDPTLRGATEVLLARALYESGGDRKRSLKLARAARADFGSAPRTRHENLELADALIAELTGE